MSSFELMTPPMIAKMRAACQLAADTLLMVGEHIRPGITTGEIDDLVHRFTVESGAKPATLGYRGSAKAIPYPKSCCTSVNEVICHGIPGPRVLQDGDIINVDVTPILPAKDGYYGDTSATFYVGTPSDEAKHLVEVTRRSLELGIEQVRDGARLGDIGAAIQGYAESQGCSVVRDFVGHGVGQRFHMPPNVPHYGRWGQGPRLKAGMVFTIEPMINLGTWECEVMDDQWTVLTADRRWSAQFEHTVLVTRAGCEVLTQRKAVLKRSEDVSWANLGPLGSAVAWRAKHAAQETQPSA
jgi:methionyl aminopeptidase